MKHALAYLPFILIVSACASDESARRNPDTAHADARVHHHHDRDRDGDGVVDESDDHTLAHREGERVAVPHDRGDTGVKPVGVAPVPADANAPARADDLSDAEITRRIHNAVNEDKSLTVAAKSVDITTQDKHVTLRGNVASDREKDTVATYARQIAGADNVQNQIDVR